MHLGASATPRSDGVSSAGKLKLLRDDQIEKDFESLVTVVLAGYVLFV